MAPHAVAHEAGIASQITEAVAAAAVRAVPAEDLQALLHCIGTFAQALTGSSTRLNEAYLALLQRVDVSSALKVAAGLVCHRCRGAVQAGRPAVASMCTELAALADLAAAQASSPHAANHREMEDRGVPTRRRQPMPAVTDGNFVQLAHEVMLGRGCQASELLRWQSALRRGEATRESLLTALLEEAVRVSESEAAAALDRETAFHVMGTGQRVTHADWQARAAARSATSAPSEESTSGRPNRLRIQSRPGVLISAIASLYAGGEHIERFMANIVGQSCFRDHVELIIVDADSPHGEREVIERYLRDWPDNIRYMRINCRIGIYDAWNIAVRAARGAYLTSTNVDDVRRFDSLECQAGALENLPFVDVVYQDFYYTLDPALSFEQIAAIGFKSELPLVTPHGLMQTNPPHNAPMWRRRLHDELGLFDTRFESAGDYDFWMRCVLADKTFYKLNDPHLAYYQNPQGLSTRPDTRGHDETRTVHRRYGRRLVSTHLLESAADFSTSLGGDAAAGAPVGDHRTVVHGALCRLARAAVPRPVP